jgi:hypothetical protein
VAAAAPGLFGMERFTDLSRPRSLVFLDETWATTIMDAAGLVSRRALRASCEQ